MMDTLYSNVAAATSEPSALPTTTAAPTAMPTGPTPAPTATPSFSPSTVTPSFSPATAAPSATPSNSPTATPTTATLTFVLSFPVEGLASATLDSLAETALARTAAEGFGIAESYVVFLSSTEMTSSSSARRLLKSRALPLPLDWTQSTADALRRWLRLAGSEAAGEQKQELEGSQSLLTHMQTQAVRI
jgi:hypothetical protein